MSRTRSLRTLSLAVVAVAPSFIACSSPPGLQRPTAGVLLQGDANETQLSTFLQREAKDWAWAGGQFDAPADRATLDASSPQTFSWHADPANFAEGDGPNDVVMTHLLEFNASQSNATWRVFTTLAQYTPDTAAWQTLVRAHQPIRVSLTTGSFVGADLPDDGGPFIGQVLTFTIE